MSEYVTRAELKAHLDPMKSDIGEIKSDVKGLVASQLVAAAVQNESKDRGARKIALVSLAATALGALWWAPEAIARAFH